mmetsp:Transcript_8226/g.19038  ORF Transcript_8226/g.19038 Transcript_8226/m.19038 type:complete len:106 (+) Transcript_8226:228-545(+)
MYNSHMEKKEQVRIKSFLENARVNFLQAHDQVAARLLASVETKADLKRLKFEMNTKNKQLIDMMESIRDEVKKANDERAGLQPKILRHGQSMHMRISSDSSRMEG